MKTSKDWVMRGGEAPLPLNFKFFTEEVNSLLKKKNPKLNLFFSLAGKGRCRKHTEGGEGLQNYLKCTSSVGDFKPVL